MIVKADNGSRCAIVDAAIDATSESGLITIAVIEAGLHGVDVAPPRDR